MTIRSHTGIPVSPDTGIANIATPTPNHPICVKLISAEDKKEPVVPKE